MFWRFGGYASISTLDTILDKQDVTVEELLDESDLIQELKQQNSKLIEFLRDEPVLKKLLAYVVADEALEEEEPKPKEDDKNEDEKTPSGLSFFGKGKDRSRSKSLSKSTDGETEQEKKEAQRKKYAYVSCEVLSSEVWSITEAVLEHPEYLREFWQYLYRPAPLDALQAGYFTKVNEALLDKKTGEMLNFLRSLDGIVPAMLQHVDCPMIMDLLLKIISLEKHEGGQGIVDWLQSQDLIPLLLGYLSSKHSSATQTSAGDFLKAIITISANATTQDQSVIGPNELTRQLVSEQCIKTLISDMLGGGNPLTVGVGIIIEVIRKNNSDYDLDNQAGPEPKTSDPIYLGTLLRQFATHVPDFMRLIRAPSARKPDLQAAFGGKIEPLGFDRFKTCELMAELLHCSNMVLLNERGAEEEVRKRDAERERLKAEGKLLPSRPATSPGHEASHDEFGSSVDSHGFHHAKHPSDDEMDEKSDSTQKLEVQNVTDEDGFEKVNAPASDELPDEVTFDDLNEKLDEGVRQSSAEEQSPAQGDDMPKPLSTFKKSAPHFDPPPTHAVDSPTRSGVTDRIHKLGVDEDTVMSEFGEEPAQEEDGGLSELDKALARPEDKPAPLFAKKEPFPAASSQPEAEEQQDIDTSVATLQGQEAPSQNGERPPFETEVDGSPVVGDLLKIQFVEHQVVPTILVFNGALDRGYNRTLAFDLFEPVKVEDAQALESMGLSSGKDVTDRILDGQRISDASQAEKGMRLGYMGHLTLIAEEVCKFGNRPVETLDQIVIDRVCREDWVQYVEGTLTETRDKDNAVLGGVRPENAIGARPMGGLGGGLQGGFGSNTANTLANAGIGNISAQDNLAMSEGTVGQTFEINAGTMLGGFGDGDDDDDMEDEAVLRAQERRAAFPDDEQTGNEESSSASMPPPLNIPPSRARRTLAARLAQKNNDRAAENDPDAVDSAALDAASLLPEDPSEDLDLVPEQADDLEDPGLQVLGLRTLRGANKLRSLFSSDDDSDTSGDSSDFDDEANAGKDHTLGRAEGEYEQPGRAQLRFGRRPSTTEAKERTPLDDGDDEENDEAAQLRKELERKLSIGKNEPAKSSFPGPAQNMDEDDDDSSDDDDLVEIRPRRTS